MRKSLIETIIGGIVVVVAAVFLIFAYRIADLGDAMGYRVTARFDSVGGLENGAAARIAGVKIGTVSAVRLDPETYLAEIELTVLPTVEIPADTAAVIASESLLGGRFVRLEPGGDENMLTEGDRIAYTQSTPGLEELLGQVIFSTAQGRILIRDESGGAP